MDIFKQKRYLILVVILLTILNLSTLIMIWLGRPQHPGAPANLPGLRQDQAQFRQILKQELAFDDAQIERYLHLQQEHREQIRRLNDDIRHVKKQMFDEALEDNPQAKLSDSLLAITQSKQAKIEQLTFQHFIDLKNLCKPEQQDKLKVLIHELFHQNAPPEKRGDMPPPPEQGERLPPPPPDFN